MVCNFFQSNTLFLTQFPKFFLNSLVMALNKTNLLSVDGKIKELFCHNSVGVIKGAGTKRIKHC